MEILNDLRSEVAQLKSEIQALKVQVAKPPVVNIDTAKLATVITQDLNGYTAAGEKVAGRIEAVAASIPRSVPTPWSIDLGTRWFLIFSIALIMASVGVGYFLTPKLEQQHVNYLQRANESQADELNYLRRKNPRDAAQYARDNER